MWPTSFVSCSKISYKSGGIYLLLCECFFIGTMCSSHSTVYKEIYVSY